MELFVLFFRFSFTKTRLPSWKQGRCKLSNFPGSYLLNNSLSVHQLFGDWLVRQDFFLPQIVQTKDVFQNSMRRTTAFSIGKWDIVANVSLHERLIFDHDAKVVWVG